MGRSKTRKKNQRSEQASDDQDPDVSETEPSSSDNISESLNDTVVLSNSNSNNVMDTDVEDSEQTTGDSTPGDESDPGGIGDVKVEAPSMPEITVSSSTSDEGLNKSRVNDWLVDQQQPQDSDEGSPSEPVMCPHLNKNNISMPGIRKGLKGDVAAACSAKVCLQNRQDEGAEDSASMSSKELWVCLQCASIGCGNHKAQGGDAELHFKTPRSDQHYVVLKLSDMDKSWCFCCQTFVDTKHSTLKDASQFIKRHHKLRLSSQSNNKTGTAPVIALGPPPPPPQPDSTPVENNQYKSMISKNKMNNRNKAGMYNSNWDHGSRDDWPLGLENLGNTCFMNSALQCLSRTKSLSTKLDLYGTGNTIEILVTMDPPSLEVVGAVTPDTNGDTAASFVHLGATLEGSLMDENGDSNHVVPVTENETGGSSPSSSEMDSLLDVASGTSSKSSPSKELSPENFKAEIEQELKKCLRLKLVIPKDSMTSRLRHAFKAMTRSADVLQGTSGYSSSEYFGRGRNVFTPSAIHTAMAKHFRPGQQHDSHELLRTVIDMMKKDQIRAFRLAIMQCYGVKKSEGKNCHPKIAELLKMWDRKLYHRTFVDEIFGGELVTFQTCMTCQSVRKSHEAFLDLSLPIRVYTKTNHIPKRTYSIFDDDGDSNSKRSLEDCLNSFIEPEQLTGSNAVECENCHRINLEKLAAGARFEDVFPGVKPPVSIEDTKPKPVEPEPPALETEMDALEPLVMEEEPAQAYSNATEDMDDLDEPAVDGIIGNTSDMEDEGNDVPPIFLADSEEKRVPTTEFLSSSDIPNKDNISLTLTATQDEGFSESDSSEEKKSASISASSSRNSISEADNVTASSKPKEVSKPIPITKCPCSRRQMVWRPPECLTIHLKRFQITSHGTSKLGDRITFPYILNLTPFCAPSGDEVEDRDLFDEDGEVKYALYGIVEHSGSLHWGHYVAYTKIHGTNPGEESSNGVSNNTTERTADRWFYISDSSVSPSSLESVLGMDPYILFYERIRGQEKVDKLAQVQRLNNPCSSNCISSSTKPAVVGAVTSTTPSTTSTTNAVAGYSYDFSEGSSSNLNYSLD